MTSRHWIKPLACFVAPKLIDEKNADLVVMALASNTGWSQREILALPVDKALDYLESIKQLNTPTKK